MTLVFQTNVSGRISVWLVEKKKIFINHTASVEWHGSDRALGIIDQALRAKKKQVSDIQKMVVTRGPGAFTAVRTGLIIANTLGTILRLPLHGVVSKHQLTRADVLRYAALPGTSANIIKPWYGKSPNITKPRVPRPQAKAKR